VTINKKQRREEMGKKQLISVVLTIVMMFVCGNSLAAKSSANKTFKGEMSFIAGLYLEPYQKIFSGMAIAGKGNVISLEAGIVLLGSFDMVFSANLGFNIPFRKRVIPFATVGLGMCRHGLPYLNLGGGIKIGLTDKLGIRVECRRWISDDVDLISVLGGISYSF
jgi:hypothetical protein